MPSSVVIKPSGSRAILGSDLGGFVGVYGKPTVVNGAYAWNAHDYVVMTKASSPVKDVWAYGFIDHSALLQVCKGFFPANPTFEREQTFGQAEGFFYWTDAGEIVMLITKNICEVKFT